MEKILVKIKNLRKLSMKFKKVASLDLPWPELTLCVLILISNPLYKCNFLGNTVAKELY